MNIRLSFQKQIQYKIAKKKDIMPSREQSDLALFCVHNVDANFDFGDFEYISLKPFEVIIMIIYNA